MKMNSSALILASALSLSSISTNISAEVNGTIEEFKNEVNVLVKNVPLNWKLEDISTSLPRSSKALKKWVECYKWVQQWEHIFFEINWEDYKKDTNRKYDSFYVPDEHSQYRYNTWKEKINCPKA